MILRNIKAKIDNRFIYSKKEYISNARLEEEVNKPDDIQLLTPLGRSLCQFEYARCFMSPFYNKLSDIGSFFLLLLEKRNKKKKETISALQKRRTCCSAVYVGSSNNEGVIPNGLRSRYNIAREPYLEHRLLDGDLESYIGELSDKSRLKSYFKYQVIMLLSNVNYALKHYMPEAIITTSESSFVSSLITDYCNRKGVKHICVMHGEKFMLEGTAFFWVNEFYVWDQYYIDLFKKERALVECFHIENPWKSSKNTCKGKCIKFYLQNEPDDLHRFAKIVSIFKKNGWKVSVRPHPKFAKEKRYQDVLGETVIEDPSEVSIISSIDEASITVSQYSTVLFQAWSRGRIACIDDVTDHELYKSLIDKNYIMFQKEHILLSSLLREYR